MTEIKRVPAHVARELIKHIRFDDQGQKTMDFCLVMSVEIWIGSIGGELACIWGIIPPSLMSHQAYLWLYTTDVIKEHQFILVRHSQMVIEELLKEYDSIVGHAIVGSDKSIRWLKWLGAKFGSPQGTGIPFRISRHG